MGVFGGEWEGAESADGQYYTDGANRLGAVLPLLFRSFCGNALGRRHILIVSLVQEVVAIGYSLKTCD